jgi:aminoglycoside phosphotransferase (APT) family kinase protein
VAAGKLARYRAAIRENFPALSLDRLDYLAEGWDSLVCLANDRLIFRFPKRPEVAARLALEIRLLPELAPYLPLPIPQFTYIARPTSRSFPYLFVGYEVLPGLTQPDWPDEVVAASWWQAEVGNFLTALHAFPVERASQLGVKVMNFTGTTAPNASWRAALETFYRVVHERVWPLLSGKGQAQVAAYFEDFLADTRHFSFEPVLLHADLLEDHLLVDPTAQMVKGVIDFGDVCLGDPAYDVSREVLPFYKGQVDLTFEQRQLFYSQLAPFIALIFGLNNGDPALVEYGLTTINQGNLTRLEVSL